MGKLLGLLALLLFATSSQAATAISSFQGSIWALSNSGAALPDSNPLSETYRVTLDADTSGHTGGGTYLDQVAFKVGSGLISASLSSAPGGTAHWSLSNGGFYASGCSGRASGFECATSSLGVPVVLGNRTHQWGVDPIMANGALFAGINQSSVKGRLVDGLGNEVGSLGSEYVTLTSPATETENYPLMLAGLGLVALIARRRMRLR